MKAVVLRQPRQLDWADVPEPRLTAEHDVLIQVEACGICGSDLRYWEGDNPWALHTLIRRIAVANYSLDRVRYMYEEYFEMLSGL